MAIFKNRFKNIGSDLPVLLTIIYLEKIIEANIFS